MVSYDPNLMGSGTRLFHLPDDVISTPSWFPGFLDEIADDQLAFILNPFNWWTVLDGSG
jgi:hypothetical protein